MPLIRQTADYQEVEAEYTLNAIFGKLKLFISYHTKLCFTNWLSQEKYSL